MEHENWVSDTKESAAASINNSFQNFDDQSPQVNLIDATSAWPKLGLQLTTTPFMLNEVERVLLKKEYNNGFNGEQGNNNSCNDYATTIASRDIMSQQANKLKAENFVISLLKIGSWERVSRNECDLVAKCYFAKRKLVWEFLENRLKSKIEIQWSNIMSLRSSCLEGQPGILELELIQPPTFFHEIDPKPRKHTLWRSVTDFTGGQAANYRRHYLKFNPGVLDKPLEKLLRNDSRLFRLSQRSYPALQSPYFPKPSFGDFTLDFGGQMHINPHQQQLSFGNVPTQTYDPAPLNLSLSDFSEYDNNQMSYWDGQGGIINNQIPNHNGGTMMMPTIPSNATSTISFENDYTMIDAYNSQNQLGGLISMQQQPSTYQTLDHDHQNMLLNRSRNAFPNGDLFSQGHYTNNMMNDDVALLNGGFPNDVVVDGQMYPQTMDWQPQNNFLSPSVYNDGLNHETTNWTRADNWHNSENRWDPPETGWFKFNTDASVSVEENRAGIGGVLRDNQGRVHAMFANPWPVEEIVKVELEAIREALKKAAMLRDQVGGNVIIESDSKVAVSWCLSPASRPVLFEQSFKDIDEAIRALNSVVIQHVSREKNGFADSLARMGREGSSNRFLNWVL